MLNASCICFSYNNAAYFATANATPNAVHNGSSRSSEIDAADLYNHHRWVFENFRQLIFENKQIMILTIEIFSINGSIHTQNSLVSEV